MLKIENKIIENHEQKWKKIKKEKTQKSRNKSLITKKINKILIKISFFKKNENTGVFVWFCDTIKGYL